MREALPAAAGSCPRRQRGTPGVRARRALPVLLLAVGCATELVAVGQGFVHRRRGYAVGRPDAAWERAALDGADLAYRGGRGTMSLQTRCGRPIAAPAVMARHLLIGLRERRLVEAGPVRVDGREAWSQTLDAVDGGVAVRLKSVTIVEGDCTFDFVLVAGAGFASAEPAFDAWWLSFRLAAAPADGTGELP